MRFVDQPLAVTFATLRLCVFALVPLSFGGTRYTLPY